MANNKLGSDPLEWINQETPAEEKKVGRPRKNNIVRGNSVQENLPEEWTRATFIVKVDLLEKLKDYSYTDRRSLKDIINEMLEDYLADKNNLLSRPGKE